MLPIKYNLFFISKNIYIIFFQKNNLVSRIENFFERLYFCQSVPTNYLTNKHSFSPKQILNPPSYSKPHPKQKTSKSQQNLYINHIQVRTPIEKNITIYISKNRMPSSSGKNTRYLLLLALLVASAYTQTFSLTDFINSGSNLKKQPTPPQHCSDWNQNGKCLECEEGWKVDAAGLCAEVPVVVGSVNDEDEGSQDVPEGFVPCRGNGNCGESLTFKNAGELSQFIQDHTADPQQQVLISDPIIRGGPAQLDFNVAPAQQIQTESFSGATAQIKTLDTTAQRSSQPASANLDFSGTNNQEENVDEADLLKTDGSYIYTISAKKLSIIRSFPVSNAKVLSTIDLSSFNPTALFLEGDYLAVFGTDYESYNYCQPQPQTLLKQSSLFSSKIYKPACTTFSNIYTNIRIYNVANKANPYAIKSYQIDGSYFNGRKTENGWIYILANQNLYRRSNPFPWYNLGSSKIFLKNSNVFYYPHKYQNPIFVNILSFNLGNPYSSNNVNVVSLLTENAQQLYMSQKHIYISYSEYRNSATYTKIHKIFVFRNYIIPFADGEVLGQVNNQFWMDEYGSFLRVSAIVQQGASVSNSVYCLNYYLDVYGKIDNIAPTERIFAARYVGRKLYLVTFRQTDPFFVIGFAHHKYPKILGELKITGFSRYLHPYDENTIIGLGRQATSAGVQLGLKIALFDVSNVWDPKEIASFELEEKYASSGAEWEHKAFLFSKQKNLLVIPGSLNSQQAKFNGAFVFYINKTTITLKSIVDHLKGPNDNFYLRNVERNLYIEDYLYCKSKCLLSISSLLDYSRVKDIEIPCEEAPVYIRPIEPVPLPQPITILPVRDFQVIDGVVFNNAV